MPIVPQHAIAVADIDGDAVFMFPDVPVGELWCGTTQIPAAPSGAISQVVASGQLIGGMYGAGSYGPWTCDHSQRLAIATSGLAPGTQYVAIWHADDKGREFSTYPQPITPTVTGAVNVPQPLEVFFDGAQPISGSVSLVDELATSIRAGNITMTGAAIQFPDIPTTRGVVLASSKGNHGFIEIGPSTVTLTNGFDIEVGDMTPLLPVANANVIWAIGQSGDVLSALAL